MQDRIADRISLSLVRADLIAPQVPSCGNHDSTVPQLRRAPLSDPLFTVVRREHNRTVLAHAVAMRVVGYRIDHELSQTALARILGMHQSAVARLEAGDHEPSLATLSRLAGRLGIEFHIDITPEAFTLRDIA